MPPPDRRQSGSRFYFKLLANLFSKYPYIVTSHYTTAFQARLRELVDSEKYDLIICEWTPYARFIRDIKGPRKVIVAHNIESTIWEGSERNETNPLKKFYIGVSIAKCLRSNGAVSVGPTVQRR